MSDIGTLAEALSTNLFGLGHTAQAAMPGLVAAGAAHTLVRLGFARAKASVNPYDRSKSGSVLVAGLGALALLIGASSGHVPVGDALMQATPQAQAASLFEGGVPGLAGAQSVATASYGLPDIGGLSLASYSPMGGVQPIDMATLNSRRF
jgi:hypothetical protein